MQTKLEKLFSLIYRLNFRIRESLGLPSTRGFLTIKETPFPKGLYHARQAQIYFDRITANSTQTLLVQSGPFKGLNYTGIKAGGSAYYPKILGCYEKEISHIFTEPNWIYDNFIDIGCGEGYYISGVKYLFPATKVYGFDVSKSAISEALRLAKVNCLEKDMEIHCKVFDFDILRSLKGRSLLMIDIEGGELDFLLKLVAFAKLYHINLSEVDFLIELHPMYSIDSSQKALDIIDTRIPQKRVNIIRSVPDFEKALFIKDKDLNILDASTRFLLLRERSMPTPWLHLT